MRLSVLIGLAIAMGLTQPVAAQNPPPDITACDMTGWSISQNPKGEAVRAAPDHKAKILGRLAPAKRAQMPEDEEFPPYENLWRTQFRITGYKDGWFQIENAAHPFEKAGSGQEHRRRLLGMKSYAGRGWAPAASVGGMLSNRARPPYGAIWREPRADAPKLPLTTDGRPWGEGSYAERVFACQGEWVEVQIAGVRGWWPGLCSAEPGTCAARAR